MTNDKSGKKEKETTIVVNGREKTVAGKEISFNELVQLAFENPPTGEFICFTITFRKGIGPKREGNLAEGETARIRKGTIFNVTATDKS